MKVIQIIGVCLSAAAITAFAAEQTEAIYYVDASFAGCDITGIEPNWCYGPRVETHLHALAALAGDSIQSDALTNGAVTADLKTAVINRFHEYWWNPKLSLPEPQIPKHIVWGLSNDVWEEGSRHRIFDALRWLSEEAAYWSPKTTIYAIYYPPTSGCNDVCKNNLDSLDLYNKFRADYAALAKELPNVTLVGDAYDGWQPSNAPHPTMPGPDFHLSSKSAFTAALRVYNAIRR